MSDKQSNLTDKEMEDLQKVCDLLTETLKATRNLNELEKLEYQKNSEIVIATFTNGNIKKVNVMLDSGTAMITDIIKQIT